MADSEPKRIQRRRTKGWKMPPNTVYVGRPTKWGNPFCAKKWGLSFALQLFRDSAHGVWSPDALPRDIDDEHLSLAALTGSIWRIELGQHPVELARSELRGKNLACWCKEGEPCHADVLLEIANG